MADEASEQANRAGMSPGRLVAIFYMVSAIVTGLFFGKVLALLWAELGWGDKSVIEGLDWTVTQVLGFSLAIGVAVACYVHPKTKALSNEVASELMKVTWPSWSETRTSTAAVVVASVVAAVILFGIDTFAYSLMVDWLPALWGRL